MTSDVVALAKGILVATSAFLVLYVPWMTTLYAQLNTVQKGFWIPPITGDAVNQAVVLWTTGIGALPSSLDAWMMGFVALICVISVACRPTPATVFFLLQAIVPWAICLGLSAMSGVSILQVRYLIFAQASFLGLLAVLACQGRASAHYFRKYG